MVVVKARRMLSLEPALATWAMTSGGPKAVVPTLMPFRNGPHKRTERRLGSGNIQTTGQADPPLSNEEPMRAAVNAWVVGAA